MFIQYMIIIIPNRIDKREINTKLYPAIVKKKEITQDQLKLEKQLLNSVALGFRLFKL